LVVARVRDLAREAGVLRREEVDHAAELAGVAFEQYSRSPGNRRAAFLRAIAQNIEALREVLVVRATAETAFPRGGCFRQ